MTEPKKALIIGGARGLGRCIAKAFVEHNIRVNVASLTPEKQVDKALLDSLDAYFEINLNNPANIRDKIENIVKQIGRIDILICNAAVRKFKYFSKFQVQEIYEIMNVNLNSHILICKSVLRGMLQRRYGKIIFISSQSGFYGYKRGTLYCSTKASLIRFGEALSKELEEWKGNVTVNVLCPGSFYLDYKKEGKETSAILPRKVKKIVRVIFHIIESKANGRIILVFSIKEMARYVIENILKIYRMFKNNIPYY